MIDKRGERLLNAYKLLLEAIADVYELHPHTQATEVLGYTGPWLSKLSPVELSEISQQVTFELHSILEDQEDEQD